jgi:hypothetical protein
MGYDAVQFGRKVTTSKKSTIINKNLLYFYVYMPRSTNTYKENSGVLVRQRTIRT